MPHYLQVVNISLVAHTMVLGIKCPLVFYYELTIEFCGLCETEALWLRSMCCLFKSCQFILTASTWRGWTATAFFFPLVNSNLTDSQIADRGFSPHTAALECHIVSCECSHATENGENNLNDSSFWSLCLCTPYTSLLWYGNLRRYLFSLDRDFKCCWVKQVRGLLQYSWDENKNYTETQAI